MAMTLLWLLLAVAAPLCSASANVQIKVTNNPADDLVATLNSNRTANKGSTLFDNPGLACIALQYIKAYQGQCDQVGGPDAKKPADSEFADTFAPNCGVSASTLSPITGRLLGCQSKYVHPSEAFSEILMKNNKSLEILYNKNHTELGSAVSGSDGGSPYFWCVLFSSGKPNSSFVLEGGVAKVSRPGCFSGANDDCSGADDWSQTPHLWTIVVGALIATRTQVPQHVLLPIRWTPPAEGMVKVNFDGACSTADGFIGVGIVVRDHTGAVIAAMSAKRVSTMEVDCIEAFAALAAIQFALDLGLHHIVLEGDSLIIVRAFHSDSKSLASFGHFVEQAKSLLPSFHSWAVQHVKREGNSVAHCLARMAFAMDNFSIWLEDVPLSLRSLVRREAPL